MGHLKAVGSLTKLGLTAAVGVSLLAGSITPLRADTLETIKQRGKLVVATLAASPYFAYMDAQGKFVGSDIEVAELYAKSLGVKIEFVPTTNDSRIAAVQTGKADVIFGALAMTAERAKSVQYSRPYEPNYNVVIGPPGKSMPDLQSIKSIGFSKGSTMDSIITPQAPSSLTIRRYDDESSTAQAFFSGQIEALAGSTPLIDVMNKSKPGSAELKFIAGTLYNGAGMRKGEKALNESINAFLDQAEADGTLAKIYKKHFGLEMKPLAKRVEGVPFTVDGSK